MGLIDSLFGKNKKSRHSQGNMAYGDGMGSNSERVAQLTFKAGNCLIQGDTKSAEAFYKEAFFEGVRLLGLRHSLTRNVLAVHSMYLRSVERDDEAIPLEALYWKTGSPESFSRGLLLGSIEPDVQHFLEKDPDWFENVVRQLSKQERH